MWVDIAWPWGLVLIACQLWAFGTGNTHRTLFATGSFLSCGTRMGIPAALTIPQRSTDFSRYEYTKIRWEREGIIAKSELKHEENGSKSEKLSKLMLFDVALQLAANVGVCLLPGLILAYDSTALDWWDLLCHLVFWTAFFFESLADIQKMSFAAKPDGTLELIRAVLENVCSVGSNCVDRSRICEDGLWAWSRHPNYFGQWMIWVSYAFASLGTILRRRSEFGVVLTIVYVGLLFDMVL